MTRASQFFVVLGVATGLISNGCAALSGATLGSGQYNVEVTPAGDTTATLEAFGDKSKRRTLRPHNQYRWKSMEAYFRRRGGASPSPEDMVDRDGYSLEGYELVPNSFLLTFSRPGYQPVSLEVRPKIRPEGLRGLMGDALLGFVLPAILYFPVGDSLRNSGLGQLTPGLVTVNGVLATALLGFGICAVLVDTSSLLSYSANQKVELKPVR